MAEVRRPAWSEFRAALEREGFHPSKSLGQNFLLDTNMARSIARDARVGEGDFVLEVGVGCGFLSVHLLELGVRWLGVEIDARLERVAAAFLAPWLERATAPPRLLLGDVLERKNALSPEVRAALPADEPWHLASNLPYGVAGPLLAVLARLPNPPASFTVLVQREVAERIAARPGEEAWGALSAKLAARYGTRLVRDVGAALFWPRPRVESAVVRGEVRADAPAELADFDALVDTLFRHRRKTVRRALREVLGAEAAGVLLEEAGVDPGARPEILSLEALAALAGGGPWSTRKRA